jgi:hypothetical protein
MSATAQASVKRRWRKGAVVSLLAIVVILAVLEIGYTFEFEYPFCLTLWLAEQTTTPNGSRVFDLVRTRGGNSAASQHWHHCTYCADIYPHAAHLAVQVTCGSGRNVYLFDWDVIDRKLLPISLRTAKLFPELVPPGYIVKALSFPQLSNDEACLIAPPNEARHRMSGNNNDLGFGDPKVPLIGALGH